MTQRYDWSSKLYTQFKQLKPKNNSSLNGIWAHDQTSQFPYGLKAQLVEHCTSITEVMGSNLVKAWIFF